MRAEDVMTMQVVGVMQEVPNRAKRQARVEVAAAAVERAAAKGMVERLNVRQATALAWIDCLAVERQQALFANFLREDRLLAAAVQAQIAGGRGQAADAVRPRQEAARLAERQDELAQQQVRARAVLRRWIGVAADQPLAGDWPEWSVDHARYGHQLPRHPALAAFEPMTREAQAKVREAQAKKNSDWSWEFDYQRRGRKFGDMVGVQVSFDLPLFPGSRQDPKIAARHAELAQLEAEREALLREHAQQLEEDLAEYQRLQRAMQRNRDSFVPLAREKVELSLASYRAGKGDLLDVIAARQELIKARLRQVELEAQSTRTGARLYFAYGEACESRPTVALGGLALVLGAGGGYWLAQQHLSEVVEKVDPSATAQDERPVLYWYDPMYPQQRFDKPGKSPFMDMQLVPRYADAASRTAPPSASIRG